MITITLAPPFDDPIVYANPFIYPILRSLLGARMILGSLGAVVALPGAAQQHVHRDHSRLFGGHEVERILPPYSITLIVPLVQLDARTGGTMMWIGSHKVPGVLRRHCQMALPLPKLGSAIIMDGRMVHAGTPNGSVIARPLLYIEYARAWFRDVDNYRTQAPLKAPAGFLATVPSAYKALFESVPRT